MAVGGAGHTPPNGPPPSNPQTVRPLVKFQTDNVPPSQYVYLQSNDVIVITTLNNITGTPLNVKWRFLTPQGEIKEGQLAINLNATVQVTALQPFEGWLLSVGLQCGTPFPTGSWCFAQIGFARNPSSINNLNLSGMIWEGLVPNAAQAGWPGQPPQRISDGAGTIRSVQGSAPAAGAEISQSVPTNRLWYLLAVHVSLTTSATVANRNPVFRLTDAAGNILYGGYSNFNQVAGTTASYSGANLGSTSDRVTGDIQTSILIPIRLAPGMRLITLTQGLQAGDQYTAPQFLVQEWGWWDA